MCIKIRVYFNKITWLIVMKMKNSSHGYDTNRPKPRQKCKFIKYKRRPSIMLFISIKQRLSDI